MMSHSSFFLYLSLIKGNGTLTQNAQTTSVKITILSYQWWPPRQRWWSWSGKLTRLVCTRPPPNYHGGTRPGHLLNTMFKINILCVEHVHNVVVLLFLLCGLILELCKPSLMTNSSMNQTFTCDKLFLGLNLFLCSTVPWNLNLR